MKNKASIQFQGTSFDKYSIACMYVFMEQNEPSKLKLTNFITMLHALIIYFLHEKVNDTKGVIRS